ncbi:1,3-beta-glucanosyltransferase [Coccidioides immitis RS]|uniref:1,3-beta-glucanosyltransferase n=3 Tax=Coccidioides immitis TaxID=5501 RepID=J3KJV1_COCIM|nr:1,3-beta-glucanosyltransferase [Coccidioides immitis RS]EAS36397.3 1,3-beta-glucanosyltransferase [Coccidioides immitis RS]KMP01752.1 EPD1 protein [Coccidioides immitis RMSCC 2394]TPX25470.1 1,3-beta-glucanosyltransferase gas1 [Coccidioides immitis]
MRLSNILASTAVVAGSLVSAELDPIVIKGSKFFYKTNGTEFFMRGVAYQEDFSSNGTTSGSDNYKDPLANVDNCKRDIPLLQELRTNTIRVYAIDPKKDHSECMKMLDDAGIYVVADLGEPKTSINRDDPKWDDELYERYTTVIDELAQYSNVLGFFAGNEVTNNKSNTEASAFVKAAVRDMKAYIKRKNYRPMGVGYATNDDAEIRDDMADYFNCNSEDEAIDFWGYNIYSWCGDSSFKESGYDAVVKYFKDFNIPVFFAEYGCNHVQPRKFTEVGAIYGPQMTPVLSGGIVYMYFQEENDYGLVKIENDKAKKLEDFKYLQKQMQKVDPDGVQMSDYKPTNTALQACPTSRVWKSNKDLPPTPNRELCNCIVKSLSCVANDKIDDEDLGDLFSTVCGLSEEACTGIATDPEKGVYGAYSMCSPREKLSFAFNSYYEEQSAKGNGQNACDFKGSAKRQSPIEPSGTCSSLIEQAGKDGKGSVTSVPNGSSSSAASPMAISPLNLNFLQLVAYLLCAAMAGAGVILL